MQIIGHSDLNGAGKGGEGLAIKQYPDGRRVLYLAHESAPMCISVIDVTHPEQPTIITQIKVEAEFDPLQFSWPRRQHAGRGTSNGEGRTARRRDGCL